MSILEAQNMEFRNWADNNNIVFFSLHELLFGIECNDQASRLESFSKHAAMLRCQGSADFHAPPTRHCAVRWLAPLTWKRLCRAARHTVPGHGDVCHPVIDPNLGVDFG